jgi:uncharacterized phage protein (TIGR01671 family)
MREYKFRAWNDFFKEMYYFDFNTNIEVRNGSLWIIYKEGSVSVNSPSIKLMQYTGRKDKNGILVFDDDILHKEGCWDVRIEFENGVFWVRDADRTRYVNKILNTPISDFAIEEFEVIGNVWGNPELLKEGSV